MWIDDVTPKQLTIKIAAYWCTDVNFDTFLWSFYNTVALVTHVLFLSWTFLCKNVQL